MSDLCGLIWCALIGLFRSRAALEAAIVVLRHQRNVLRRNPRSGWRSAILTVSLPKTRFEHSDAVVRQGSDTRFKTEPPAGQLRVPLVLRLEHEDKMPI